MSSRLLALFDIDGTLLTAAGAGRRAIDRAFDRGYGKPDACAELRFDGMTDRVIVRMALDKLGVPPTEERIDALLDDYAELLAEELSAASDEHCRALPGAEVLVQRLTGEGWCVGLGTGNIERGAQLKLERVGIAFSRFRFGGYGSDAEHRPEVIRIALERGARRLGASPPDCTAVVIGDTPKDISAAHEAGCRCLAVATGPWTREDLLRAGADCAVEDLRASEGWHYLTSLSHRAQTPDNPR